MKKTFFVFLRHAESEKNIIDTVGGVGKKLTSRGIEQAEKVARHLFRVFGDNTCEVISSPAIQAVETAGIICKYFGCFADVSGQLTPADMGIITGVKEEEIKACFPDISVLFQKWRAGEIEACDLAIPGREPPEVFWGRMISFLNASSDGGVKIIVTTRSIMVFAKNLIQNNLPYRGGGYKHMSVNHCEVVSFYWDEGVPFVVPLEGWGAACDE